MGFPELEQVGATSAVRSLPLVGRGWGWGALVHGVTKNPTPLASLATLPTRGRVTEFAAPPIQTSSFSGLDIRLLHHVGPFHGFVGQEPGELLGCAAARPGAELGEPVDDLLLRQRHADRRAELLHH